MKAIFRASTKSGYLWRERGRPLDPPVLEVARVASSRKPASVIFRVRCPHPASAVRRSAGFVVPARRTSRHGARRDGDVRHLWHFNRVTPIRRGDGRVEQTAEPVDQAPPKRRIRIRRFRTGTKSRV
jgi:hypothetical protein